MLLYPVIHHIVLCCGACVTTCSVMGGYYIVLCMLLGMYMESTENLWSGGRVYCIAWEGGLWDYMTLYSNMGHYRAECFVALSYIANHCNMVHYSTLSHMKILNFAWPHVLLHGTHGIGWARVIQWCIAVHMDALLPCTGQCISMHHVLICCISLYSMAFI